MTWLNFDRSTRCIGYFSSTFIVISVVKTMECVKGNFVEKNEENTKQCSNLDQTIQMQ